MENREHVRQLRIEDRPIIFSYGGGTQSIAICILIAQGKLPKPDRIVFADTGMEASETWEYTEMYVAPLLAQLSLTIEVASHRLATVSLYSKKGKDLLIPAYTSEGKLPTFCSKEWKTLVVRRYLGGEKTMGPIRMWIGFSTDEVERLKPADVDWIEHWWPLCFDVPMSRVDCKLLVERYGWPEPPKSSCYICPHRRNAQWRRLKENYPEDFEKAVALDREIRAKDTRGGVWLHEARKPLDEIDFETSEDQPSLFSPQRGTAGDMVCESGFCWT